MSYADLLERKQRTADHHGIAATPDDVNHMLHPWQREIVAWAARTGRAAIWADTGLGKTFMQVEWARLSGTRPLIVAPLAVCQQTIREAARLDVNIRYVRSDDPQPGIRITNYEMVDRFDPTQIDAVILDESSILKHSDGKTRTFLIEHFRDVPRKLSCTATPAPNDPEELTNQAEFLGVMSRVEMLASFFVHDSDAGWRLKGHAQGPMFRWMASWAVAIRRPSDMDYPDDGYILPELVITPHLLPVNIIPEGQLFATDLGGVSGRAEIRRQTIDARVGRAAHLVANEPDEPWIVWCGLNAEADLLSRLIPGSVNVQGSWNPDDKADAFLRFADGNIRVLITKPSMAAFGLNWQHCARMVFVGLSDSYEAYYQSIRRCYRYGQNRPVHAHIVLSEVEGQIAVNVTRKETTAARTTDELIRAFRESRTT